MKNNLLDELENDGSPEIKESVSDSECDSRCLVPFKKSPFKKSIADICMEISGRIDLYMRQEMVNRPDRMFSKDEINGALSKIMIGVISSESFRDSFIKSRAIENKNKRKDRIADLATNALKDLMPVIMSLVKKDNIPVGSVITYGGVDKDKGTASSR